MVLPVPPEPNPPASEVRSLPSQKVVCMERSWTGSVGTNQPLILDRKVRPQSEKEMDRQPNLAPAQILEGFSEEDPNTQNPGRVSVRPTFDDVCVFQWQLPQQLIFAGRVNDAGCRVPVGSQGELWPGQGSGTHGGKTTPHFLRPAPCQAPRHSQAHGAAPQGT